MGCCPQGFFPAGPNAEHESCLEVLASVKLAFSGEEQRKHVPSDQGAEWFPGGNSLGCVRRSLPLG